MFYTPSLQVYRFIISNINQFKTSSIRKPQIGSQIEKMVLGQGKGSSQKDFVFKHQIPSAKFQMPERRNLLGLRGMGFYEVRGICDDYHCV